MVRLPLLSDDAILDRLISGLDRTDLDRPLQPADAATAHRRLFGTARRRTGRRLRLPPDATMRDLYRSAVATEAVPGRLRPHLGKLGVVTVSVVSAHATNALACRLHSPPAIALR